MTDQAKSTPLRPKLLHKIVGWLRAGYPQGVPRSDYVALFAVLHRHLTDVEVVSIAEELTMSLESGDGERETEISHSEIEDAIARFAKERPAEADIARVAAHLAAGGWPLADPPTDAE